jgi:hypothetical protein
MSILKMKERSKKNIGAGHRPTLILKGIKYRDNLSAVGTHKAQKGFINFGCITDKTGLGGKKTTHVHITERIKRNASQNCLLQADR